MLFRILIILALSLSVAGCASEKFKIAPQQQSSTSSINVTDDRPLYERETKSPKVGKTIYYPGAASYYPGDDQFQPNIVEALKFALSSKLGRVASSTKISIQHARVLNYFGAHDNENKPEMLGPQWSNKFANVNFVNCDISGLVNGKKFKATYAESYEIKTMFYWVAYTSSEANEATTRVVKKCIEEASNSISSLVVKK